MASPRRRDVQAIASRIRAARMRRRLSKAQVSALSGIDPGTLGDIESARRPPRYHQLIALHEGLKTKPGELLSV